MGSLEADILIRDCAILPMNGRETIEKGLIAIKGDKIGYVGRFSEAPKIKAEKIIEGCGKVAIPGLVNCHTHVAMTLFRGIGEDQDLNKWLNETIWPLEAKLKPRDVYDGALLGCLEMIKSGVTCFADMYFHEDMVAKAVKESGLRAVLAPGILEAGSPERGEKLLKEAIEFAEKHRGAADGRISVRLGPHAIYTCSSSLLKKVREAASSLNAGIHVHLAESKEMVKLAKVKYGLTEVELLESIGFLKPDVLAAHCICLSERERQIMAKHDVKVAYNPVANMKIAQGIPKIKDLMDLGVTVGIGTDGPASNNAIDMLKDVKFAALLQKVHYMDPTVMPAYQVVRMATVNGAKALGLEANVGSLEAGKKADIVLINFEKPHLTPRHDIYANIVYSACGSDVETVIVNGAILMEGREVKTLDEEDVMRRASRTALDLLAR
jgi:5-methylthioadenosine/S-adenosylhomocysteine deaminase